MLERNNNNNNKAGGNRAEPAATQWLPRQGAHGHLGLLLRAAAEPLTPSPRGKWDQEGRCREPQNHQRSGWKGSLAEKHAGREGRRQVKRETP